MGRGKKEGCIFGGTNGIKNIGKRTDFLTKIPRHRDNIMMVTLTTPKKVTFPDGKLFMQNAKEFAEITA